MAAPEIPISLISYGTIYDQGKVTPSYWSGVSIGGTLYSSTEKVNALIFFAIDRKNPEAKPAFNAPAPSSSEIPDGLKEFLNDNYILAVVSQSLQTKDVPQGAQYAMLMANGAGAGLRRVEQLNTQFSSSILLNVAYQLLSIPGSGPGMEETGFPLGASIKDKGGTPMSYSTTSGPSPIMTGVLIPTDVDGTTLYTPSPLHG